MRESSEWNDNNYFVFMSIFNFAANPFFDDDDFALSSVASERLKLFVFLLLFTPSQKSDSNHFPLDFDMVEVFVFSYLLL